jgi:hypothetical protein
VANPWAADRPAGPSISLSTQPLTNHGIHLQFLGVVNDSSRKTDEMHIEEEHRTYTRLSCLSSEHMWFALMQSYDGMGGFLSIISMIGIILYFVTSSDSGSLVIDCLSANGDPDPPKIQVKKRK